MANTAAEVETIVSDEVSKAPEAIMKPTTSGNDATFRKPSTEKPKRARFATFSSLFCLTLFIYAVDQLLLNQTDDTRTNPMVRDVWRICNYITSNISSLDCFCTVIPLALIGVQLARKRGKGADSAKLARASKNTKQDRRREDVPRLSGSSTGSDSAAAPRTAATERCATPLMRCNQAIDLAAREGDAKKAGKILMQFETQSNGQPGNGPDTVSYNLVIRACAKKGDFQAAEHWLRRMASSGIEATVCSYNTVLDACAKAGHPEASEAWLEKMLSKGVAANVISYATVIYARARRGEEALAEAWQRKMMDAGIDPDAVCYNSLIHACGVSGNPAGAERWIQEMLSRGLEATVTTYTAVIDACAKGGDVARAEKWLDEMITKQVQPNVVTFTAVIDACAKANDRIRAESVHYRMIECGVSPNAHSFSAVINACAKAGDVDKAEEWLAKVEEAGVLTDVVVYSSVIDACGKVGDADRAAAVFQRMQANGIQPHIVAYAALARPYAYRGDWAEVERIAAEMATRGVYPNEYFLYAQLLSYATFRPRQATRAEDCFRKALHMGLKANDHVVGVLVRAVGRERCVELMQELCNGRSIPIAPSRGEGGARGNRVKPLPRRRL
jgi:pentatricopeptide repeat protein